MHEVANDDKSQLNADNNRRPVALNRLSRRRAAASKGVPSVAMHEREIERAAQELRQGRRRAIERSVLALVAGGCALAALGFSSRLALALGAGAAVEALLAAAASLGRRDTIGRLALQPAAYVLPEVRDYGRRSAEPSERERLAAWLGELVAESRLPGSIYLGDRVTAFARDLATLARELGSPAARVEPVSAVACRRLLTDAVGSPLYNPRLSAEDLRLTLDRIRSGIHAG